jgi:hypothetical protein
MSQYAGEIMTENPIKLFASRSEQYPQPDEADTAQAALRTTVSAIPVLGGPISEVLAIVLAPAVARRRDQWLKDLADDLEKLEKRVEGFKVDRLSENEEFVSAAIQITRSVISTHKKEKREALRNALLNIALGKAPDEDVQQMFLSYLDSLTSWHIRILGFFKNPLDELAKAERERRAPQGQWAMYMGSPSQVLEKMFPELQGNRSFYDQVVKDLYGRGLMSSESLHGMMTANGATAKRTTERGDAFIAFIANPL